MDVTGIMQFFRPIIAGAHLRERLVACVGAAVGIALTMVVSAGVPLDLADLPIIVAPLGASAVLAFAVPASPLAQPWPLVGGNILSTLVGVAVFQLLGDTIVAAGLAVGLAIVAMSLARCLHPPGGAAALTAVIGSGQIHAAGYAFAFAPVGINSIALVTCAMFFHGMSGHSYPHRPAPVPRSGLLREDIDAALDDLHESFDIAREDLEALLARAELHAEARRTPTPARPSPPRPRP